MQMLFFVSLYHQRKGKYAIISIWGYIIFFWRSRVAERFSRIILLGETLMIEILRFMVYSIKYGDKYINENQ